jgi:hypothetical protein
MQLSTATVNAQADYVSALLNGGYFRVYTADQPKNADISVKTQVLLVELRFAERAAPSAQAGVINFNAITSGIAKASGKAAWFRALRSDGVTAVMDGSIGGIETDSNLVLNSVSISARSKFSITGFTHSLKMQEVGS